MARVTAPDRMRRVLAIVPWIMANPGQSVSEIAERFGVAEKALLDDLGVVFMVGLPPYSPDALLDVWIDDDGYVSIDLADFFTRPLQLTPSQGLALLASSDALLSVPGTDPDGSLARALAKLRATLGLDADTHGSLEVTLGDAEAETIGELRRALAAEVEVELHYYSYGRDVHGLRVVSPWRVYSDGGSWYFHGWCHQAEGERLFRIDRIRRVVLSEVSRKHAPAADLAFQTFYGDPNARSVTLQLQPAAEWVVRTYPCQRVDIHHDGSIEIDLVITADAWLHRLLLRLGPTAKLVRSDDPADADRLRRAADRILDRYHG